MFIVGMSGGLGNQMYEYAFYEALRKHYGNSAVKMDVFKTRKLEHNGYELKNVFGIDVAQANAKEICQLSSMVPHDAFLGEIRSKVKKKLFYKGIIKCNQWDQPDYTAYYPEVFQFDKSSSLYFNGVWANEKYFKNIASYLIEKFQFQKELDEKNKKTVQEMKNTESVGVHIRRGDYAQFGANIVSSGYYQSALQYIQSKTNKQIKVYVFSNDNEEARKVIGNQYDACFVDWNTGKQSYRDMQLMSCCKNNITANSSFSFWGAYLNQYKNKIVIAPTATFSPNNQFPFTADGWINMDESGRIVAGNS